MEINKDIADLEAEETRKSKRKKFVLCYHSLNVRNCKSASVKIRKLAEAVGSPISVAVVPSIGGVPESEAEAFREEVGKLMDEGFEIVLHGARHRADLFVKRNPWGKLGLVLSHNGAEFSGLNEKLSQTLLKRAVALWDAHGYGRPVGFVPPVWLGNRHLKNQVLEQFETYEDINYIYKNDGRVIRSQLFTFSIVPRIFLALAMTIACVRLMLPFGVPRVVIHAKDFSVVGEKGILNLVRFAGAVREKVLYKDL